MNFKRNQLVIGAIAILLFSATIVPSKASSGTSAALKAACNAYLATNWKGASATAVLLVDDYGVCTATDEYDGADILFKSVSSKFIFVANGKPTVDDPGFLSQNGVPAAQIPDIIKAVAH